MRSIGCDEDVLMAVESNPLGALPAAAARGIRGNALRSLGLVLITALLAACAQSSVVSRRAALTAPSREAAFEPRQVFRAPARAPLSIVRRREPSDAASVARGAKGLASFYTEGQQTANGEKYDPTELTAAHRTLPFGTRLQVTNVATGRSVTVRVNDRGPFVKGRVVDVSYSAAQALGMVNSGVANVKVDLLR